jgi:ribosomal protein S18 acetylase RimI-like enzyme
MVIMAKIRELNPTDVESVLDLWNENWTEDGSNGLTEADRMRISKVLNGYVTHEQVCCFVAEEAAELVGFITASLSVHPVMEGKTGEIEELYVQPRVRQLGVGAELVKQAMSFLRKNDASVFRTYTSIESEKEKEFWQSLGWQNDVASFSYYENG